MSLFGPPDVNKLKAKQNVNGLIKALNYQKDWMVRKAAAEALGEIKDSRAVEPLSAALKDSNEWVRWHAAEALGKIGASAVEPLIVALKDRDQKNAHRAVAEALGRIGTPAVEPLIVALKDRDQNVRCAAAEALGKIKDARAVEPLIAALKDTDVRARAAGALKDIGGTTALNAYTDYVRIAKLTCGNCKKVQTDRSQLIGVYTYSVRATDTPKSQDYTALYCLVCAEARSREVWSGRYYSIDVHDSAEGYHAIWHIEDSFMD